jgi:NADH:ubiquinone oxidoreductase subunit F (NADH-binding)
MKSDIKILTKYWNKIRPNRIEDYIKVGGYRALRKFIRDMDPKSAILEIKKSGLCGRGGAGYPTGEKLELVANKSSEKYFICNVDESEPGTYKDRVIVDNNPHLLIEGIAISALAIGAKKAWIYVNGQYEKQKEMLEKAIKDAREKEFLGRGIIGSCYDLEIEIFSGAGGYICGEETALINSIEGDRGEPGIRPPYPTDSGLFEKPTAVNNAETISNIPWIISNGGEEYAKIGSSVSPGTKLFCLGGALKNPGIYEAPLGITIRELIYDFGGGLLRGKEFWFAQVGGAAGRLILENELSFPLAYDRKAEISPGSGSIFVVDKSASINDLILSWTGFFRRESCGKCVPCREGTFRLYEIARRLSDGEISDRDKKAMEDILWTLNNTSFCPLGKFAATAFSDAVNKLNLL